VRPLRGCLLVIHRRRSHVTKLAVRVRIGIVTARLSRDGAVRRLPAHLAAHMRAVAAASRRLLAVGRWRLQDLRRIVPRRRIGGEGRPRRRLRTVGHLVLSRRLRARRWLNLAAHVRRNSHATIRHGLHVVVRGLPLELRHTVHTNSRRYRRWSIGLRHRRLAICAVLIFVVRPSRSCGLYRTRSQGSSSGSFRLFNGAGVVILVTREGGAACESLLAVRIRALVWALARMNTAMACKRARVAKGL
jgi:hypothetical protein